MQKRSNLLFRDLSLRIVLFDAIIIAVYLSALINVVYMRDASSSISKWFNYTLYLIDVVCVFWLINEIVISSRTDLFVVLFSFLLLYIAVLSFGMGTFSPFEYLRDAVPWILVLIVSYMYGYRQYRLSASARNIVVLGTLFYSVICLQNIEMHRNGLDPRGGIIGVIYYSFGMLELIYLLCSKKTKVLFSVLISLLLLFSSKRTGIIIILFGISLYYFFSIITTNKLQRNILIRYIGFLLLIIIAGIGLMTIIERYNLNILERFQVISEDNASGRALIWQLVINSFNNGSSLKKIIGRGYHAVPKIVHPFGRYLFAHNGFLEVLYDFGWVGFILFILVFIWFFVITVKMLKEKYQHGPLMLFSFIIMLLLSLFGYFFEESRFVLPVAIATGYCLGTYKRYRRFSKQKIGGPGNQ